MEEESAKARTVQLRAEGVATCVTLKHRKQISKTTKRLSFFFERQDFFYYQVCILRDDYFVAIFCHSFFCQTKSTRNPRVCPENFKGRYPSEFLISPTSERFIKGFNSKIFCWIVGCLVAFVSSQRRARATYHPVPQPQAAVEAEKCAKIAKEARFGTPGC